MKPLMLLLALLSLSVQANPELQKRKLSELEVKAIIQAVEDEIYDYGYQKYFYQMGEDVCAPPNPNSPTTRMWIYIKPELNVTYSSGSVIYKLMPYGEVIREFVVRKDGMVIFSANPENGFPPTQESNTKTLYMDDDELCQAKHDWLKRSFIVVNSPSAERIQEAVQRQKLRTGFSDWEYRHHKKK
jgi:hypothetical protein